MTITHKNNLVLSNIDPGGGGWGGGGGSTRKVKSSNLPNIYDDDCRSGPKIGIEPTTSRPTVKRSIDCAYPAANERKRMTRKIKRVQRRQIFMHYRISLPSFCPVWVTGETTGYRVFVHTAFLEERHLPED